jgi:hypothetical protein
MGFQTEFMILNDAVDMVRKYPMEFAKKIYDACLDGSHVYQMRKELGYYPDTYSMSLGNHCNPIVASRPQHADVMKVYIAGHNDMINVSFSRWSGQYKKMATNFPNILNSHISILEQTLRDLKKLRQEIEPKVEKLKV